MTRILPFVVAAAVLVSAQEKPNFSGTWDLESSSTQLPTAAGNGRGGTGDATTAGGAARAGGGGNGGGGNARGGGGGAARAPGRGFDPGPNAVGGRTPLGARDAVEAGPRRVTIRQTEKDITIGGTVYTLDGTGGEPTPIGRPAMKASWDGKKLLIQTVRDLRGTNVTQRETRSLSNDGKTMTVEIRIDTPQGEARATQKYKKE